MLHKRTAYPLFVVGTTILATQAVASPLIPGSLLEAAAKKATASFPKLSYRQAGSSAAQAFFAQGQAPTPAPAAQAPTSRALPDPYPSPPFPLSDWVTDETTPIGESWDAPTGPLQKALVGDSWDKSRIKFYGWFDAGYTASTSKHSDLPVSYDLYPNHPVVDQFIFKVERMPDTVQTDHIDWGFRTTSLFGIDYRFTAADGYFYDQLQKRNALYGYDPVELWGQIYFPKIAEGSVVTVGRYISPPDIEAQLAPENYLYSHSLMFTVDPYTYTGISALTRLSKYWSIVTGITAGNDTSPWEKSGELEGELLLGWHSHSNYDSLWFGTDAIGDGHFAYGHDNMNLGSITWGHKYSSLWHMQTQMYYLWEYDAAKGGSEIDGPNEPWSNGGGAGPIIPGQSHAWGYVNYLEYLVDKKSYMSFRTDWLGDPDGWRTGVDNDYMSVTLGYAHYFTPTTEIRPELRYDFAKERPGYDLDTRKAQWTLGGDIIFHF